MRPRRATSITRRDRAAGLRQKRSTICMYREYIVSISVYVYVYTRICIHIYTYTEFISMHVYVYTHTYIHTYAHVCMQACISSPIEGDYQRWFASRVSVLTYYSCSLSRQFRSMVACRRQVPYRISVGIREPCQDDAMEPWCQAAEGTRVVRMGRFLVRHQDPSV